jgi:hypothetical protein
VARPAHLVRRFLGSVVPARLSADDARWAAAQLLPAERGLWSRMSPADRRHAVGVARDVERRLGAEATRPVLAAALLHDVGKIDAGLGTYGRVLATLSGAAVGHDPVMITRWTHVRGFTRRVGLYLQHDRLGGDLLELAGSDPLTVAWAREHHLAPETWTVPAEVGEALKAADDD